MFSGFVMGRRKNEVWGSFNEVRVDGVLRAKCKKCEETVVNNPERLKSHLTKCTSQFQEVVSKRSKQALSDVVLAANLLDSRYYGEKLNPVETKQAIDYVKTAKPDCLPSLMKYVAKEPPYSLLGEAFLASTPTSWWAAGTKLGFCPILAEIALSIVSAVPASAGLERHFSTLGLTYGKLRTQLGVEKAGKLAFLYKQLNAK